LPYSVVRASGIPDRPKGGVRGTEPPKSRALYSHALARAEFVIGGYGIEHPHLMHVIVLVVIGIMRIQRRRIELDLGFGLKSTKERFLYG